jgi:PAS domain S-box-containing protein
MPNVTYESAIIKTPSKLEILRAEAESRTTRAQLILVNPQPGEELLHEVLHELRVHQIELDMQNEELRHAQILIEESRDRYVDLYEFAPVGYLTLSREGLISEINLTGATLMGVDRKYLLQRRFAGYITVTDRDRWHRHFISALQKDEKQRCELAFLRDDGACFHAQLDFLHIKDGDTSSIRIALTDITERKLNEEHLRIAAIAFESQEGMIVTDANSIILKVNHAFTRLTGYSREEAMGKTPALFKSDRQNESFYLNMWKDLQQKHYWQGEIWNKRKDGLIYAVWQTISAVTAPDGNITHYVSAFSDISHFLSERPRPQK